MNIHRGEAGNQNQLSEKDEAMDGKSINLWFALDSCIVWGQLIPPACEGVTLFFNDCG